MPPRWCLTLPVCTADDRSCHSRATSKGQSWSAADNHGHIHATDELVVLAGPARTHPANVPDKDEVPGPSLGVRSATTRPHWEPISNSRGHEATPRRTKDVLPQPSEGQIPILPGLMQCPIPAGLVLIIEIVLVSPTTRAPKPSERSSDPAEHGRLPLLCPCDALSSLPDARTRRPAALVSSVRVATGPRSVRTASGTCGYERAGAVTTGTKKSQAAASSCP